MRCSKAIIVVKFGGTLCHNTMGKHSNSKHGSTCRFGFLIRMNKHVSYFTSSRDPLVLWLWVPVVVSADPNILIWSPRVSCEDENEKDDEQEATDDNGKKWYDVHAEGQVGVMDFIRVPVVVHGGALLGPVVRHDVPRQLLELIKRAQGAAPWQGEGVRCHLEMKIVFKVLMI